MRKPAQKKNDFPQNAEVCPEEKRLSAKCGNLKAGFAIGLVLRNKLNWQTLQVSASRKLERWCTTGALLGRVYKGGKKGVVTFCMWLNLQFLDFAGKTPSFAYAKLESWANMADCLVRMHKCARAAECGSKTLCLLSSRKRRDYSFITTSSV